MAWIDGILGDLSTFSRGPRGRSKGLVLDGAMAPTDGLDGPRRDGRLEVLRRGTGRPPRREPPSAGRRSDPRLGRERLREDDPPLDPRRPRHPDARIDRPRRARDRPPEGVG